MRLRPFYIIAVAGLAVATAVQAKPCVTSAVKSLLFRLLPPSDAPCRCPDTTPGEGGGVAHSDETRR